MSKRKAVSTAKKPVVIRMCKNHRILILRIFTLLIIATLIAMIHVISSSEFGLEIDILLLALATIPFLPFPLYYATWHIIFAADGMQKRIFGIKQ